VLLRRYSTVVRTAALGLTALTLLATAASAQNTETFTARAIVKTGDGVSASAPFTLTIQRFSTIEDQRGLTAAIKRGGTEGARKFLLTRSDVGSLQLGSRTIPVKHAFARPMGGGRLITATTGEPILYLGEGVSSGKSPYPFALGVVMVEIPDNGAGQGELVPAARVRIDEHGSIVTEAFNSNEVVRLVNAGRK
jgi:hypothetical protein